MEYQVRSSNHISCDSVFLNSMYLIEAARPPLSREPHKVKLAYTEDSIWRNRDQFFTGRDAIAEFLTKKWEKEDGYRLRKELFAFNGNKM